MLLREITRHDYPICIAAYLAPGAALNASLADLSAISGETGESLKTIERYARDAAKTFGGSAAQSVESYKLLLSQLSPLDCWKSADDKGMVDHSDPGCFSDCDAA